MPEAMGERMRLNLRVAMIFSCGFVPPLLAQEPPDAAAESGTEIVWELDTYYSSVGLHIPLTESAIPISRGKSEAEIYGELLLQSLRPQMMLLEVSVNPLPLLGVYIRDQHPGFYADMGDDDANVIESLTAGFPEPAAISLFLGSALNFVKPGQKRRDTNKGYIGYLASAGTQHIKDNMLIEDDWYELEWKLKGERDFKDEQLSWSFRTGAKFHANDEIADTIYVGFKRSHLDFAAPLLSLLDNSQANMRLDFTLAQGRFAYGELTIGKKIPLSDWDFALTLDTGLIFENQERYLGRLADPDDEIIFVIRPNIQF